MEIVLREKDGILICAVSGEIDMYAAPEFHAQYLRISSRKSTKKIVIDLQNASYMDSSGIGVLFQIFSNAKTQQLGFCVCNAHGMVAKLFQLSHMAAIMPIENNLESALDRVRNIQQANIVGAVSRIMS